MDYIIANINGKLQPSDREELYETPLDEQIRNISIGETIGGGSFISENNEIENCEIEIKVNSSSIETIQIIIEILERLGAPKGSKLFVTSTEEEISFGKNEGLAVYLNGTSLPEKTYQECDIHIVYDEITSLLQGIGSIQSHWQGSTESAFYMYGSSFKIMKNKIKIFLDSYPLCEKCRVVQIA